MAKNRTLLLTASLFLTLLAVSAASAYSSNCYSGYCDSYPSAYYSNAYPSFSSSSSANAGYNSQSFAQNPVYTTQNDIANRFASSNFDSSAYASNYQGASAKMNVQYNEYTLIKANGKMIRTVSYADNSIYLGASQSVNSDLQNRQMTNSLSTDNSKTNYNGGFSWSKADAFNSQNANSNSDWDSYYYAPVYSDGYYNWGY